MERLDIVRLAKSCFPKKPLIVILGATASGKTASAIEFSKYADIEIISADSRQIYKYLDIGTAKPSRQELNEVKHHFIDIIKPDEYYSAGIFGRMALETAEKLFDSGKLPVVAGGSGFFIQALCQGLFDEDEQENRYRIREILSARLNADGKEALYNELLRIDPNSAMEYTDKNPRRAMRALEYFYSTGKLFSTAKKETAIQNIFQPLYFEIEYPRDVLYDRINKRTKIMWNSGLVEETEKVLKMGYSPDLNALNTVGYKECASFLRGDISISEAIEQTMRNTRRYAKRQITWFRRNQEICRLDGLAGNIAEQIYKVLVMRNPI